MKRYIILFIYITFSISSIATTIPLSTIRDSLSCFLKKVEKNQVDRISNNDLIVDVESRNVIKEGDNGIFMFNLFSNYGYVHFLLIEEDSFFIINMEEEINVNLEKLLAFFSKNEIYTKKDILFYISYFLYISQLNLQKRNSPYYL